MRDFACPPAADVFHAPELAVLAVLDAAVTASLVALVVAHPETPSDPDRLPPEHRAATALVAAAHALADALDRYRFALARALERQRERDADDPF